MTTWISSSWLEPARLQLYARRGHLLPAFAGPDVAIERGPAPMSGRCHDDPVGHPVFAALYALARELPAPVLVDVLGYSRSFTAQLLAELRVDWNAYVALKSRERRAS